MQNTTLQTTTDIAALAMYYLFSYTIITTILFFFLTFKDSHSTLIELTINVIVLFKVYYYRYALLGILNRTFNWVNDKTPILQTPQKTCKQLSKDVLSVIKKVVVKVFM